MDDKEKQVLRMLKWGASIVAIGVALLVLWPLYKVPTGSRGVITVGGAIRGIEGEGFTLLAPWQKLDLFNIRAEVVEVKDAQGATADTQPVTTSMTVRYNVLPDKVAEVFERYTHDGNLDSYVQTATLEIFKAVTARYTATELIAKRASVSADISTALRAKVLQYGTSIINIDMTNFAFSASYMAAINEKSTQEQLQLAAERKLKTVESEQKQKVAIADADSSAAKVRADAAAYVTLAAATAQAKSTQMEGEAKAKAMDAQALALSRNPVLVELTKAERWNGALPVNMYASGPVPFLNLSK